MSTNLIKSTWIGLYTPKLQNTECSQVHLLGFLLDNPLNNILTKTNVY